MYQKTLTKTVKIEVKRLSQDEAIRFTVGK